ncbi:hypothetical protein P4O66_017620, partial [Electrophorus voltai]
RFSPLGTASFDLEDASGFSEWGAWRRCWTVRVEKIPRQRVDPVGSKVSVIAKPGRVRSNGHKVHQDTRFVILPDPDLTLRVFAAERLVIQLVWKWLNLVRHGYRKSERELRLVAQSQQRHKPARSARDTSDNAAAARTNLTVVARADLPVCRKGPQPCPNCHTAGELQKVLEFKARPHNGRLLSPSIESCSNGSREGGAWERDRFGSRPRLEDSPPWIVEHPSDLIVSKGEPATLNCRAEGRPVPAVEWYKDGEHVETDRDDPRSHRMLLPSGALFFLRIVHGRRTKPDEGVYTCVARNYLGEAVSRNASLQVATLRDDFRQAPGDVVVAVGEPAVMECVPPRGHPEPSVSWKRNNVRISDKDGRISMQAGKLLISHTRKSDAGMYVCVGSNMVGERDSDPAELVVFERPVFIRRPVNQIALAEETVDFLCEVHGDPAPTVRWRREEDELPRGRFEIRSDSTLRVLKVRQEDEGTYTCATENSVGRTEASATLQVHVPPKIVHPPQDQISAQGHAVTFHCGTKGNPPPAVFWQKEGTQMLLFPGQPPSQAGRYSVSMSGELTITDVHREDAGYYLCQAISVAGSTISKALLQVDTGPWNLVPPIIRQGPANQTLVPGSSARLQCQAVGTPPPGIRWEKDGRDLPSDGARVKLMENGTLHIGALQETDSGTYTCVASSSAGETSWSGAVTVRAMGMPAFPPLSQALQLPGPPQKPVATDVSQNSVTLTWQPNQHEGGAAVTSYIIEAFSQSVGSMWQTVADQVKQEKHTALGLYPNTVYLFIVRAVNSYGLSDPSPISEPVRTQAGGPGGAAVDHRRVQEDLAEVTVHLHPPEFLSPSSVRMSWTVKHEPDYIEGYRLLYRPVGGAWLAQDVKAGPDSTAILSELRSGMEYELKIRPYFREFQGSDSELTVVSIPKEVLCGPPQAVSAVQLGNSSTVRVSWEPPVAVTLAEPVLEYRVWCVWGNTSGAELQVNQSAAGHQHWTLLDGLEPELQYRVQVLAMTRDGAGAPSHPIFIRLGATVKNPPLPGLKDESVGLSEQISGVVRQPAFIAGLGAASWLVLMCFSAWIYCRHRRSKELGHYVASFAYTPAVGLSHSDGSGLVSGRPCMVGSNMGTHPWLADAWPSANFTAAGKDTVNCCSGRHDSSERYYNTTGIPSVLNQSDTCSQASNEGPIYSTIAPIDEDLSSPCSRDPEPGLSELELRDPDRSAAQYARLQYPRMDHASAGVQGSPGSQGSVGTCPWSEVLTLPRLSSREQWLHERQQHRYDQPQRHPGTHGRAHGNPCSEDDGDWCPPLPERMYLMEGVESSATLPLRGERVCRVSTYGRQSTHGIAPAAHDELQSNPQLLQPDLLPSPNLLTKLECHNGSPARAAGHWRDFKKDVLFTDNSEHFTGEYFASCVRSAVRNTRGPFDHSTPSHPRPKKRSLRERPRRREIVQSGGQEKTPKRSAATCCDRYLCSIELLQITLSSTYLRRPAASTRASSCRGIPEATDEETGEQQLHAPRPQTHQCSRPSWQPGGCSRSAPTPPAHHPHTTPTPPSHHNHTTPTPHHPYTTPTPPHTTLTPPSHHNHTTLTRHPQHPIPPSHYPHTTLTPHPQHPIPPSHHNHTTATPPSHHTHSTPYHPHTTATPPAPHTALPPHHPRTSLTPHPLHPQTTPPPSPHCRHTTSEMDVDETDMWNCPDVQPIQHGWVTAVFRSSRPSRCFPAGGPSPLSYTARRAKEVWRTRHSSCVGVNVCSRNTLGL